MIVEFPPGKYFIGDPSYTMTEEEWSMILNHTNRFNFDTTRVASVNHKGFELVAATTAYGCGEYKGSNGVLYGVDSGIIGIMDIKSIDTTKFPESKLNNLACVIKIDRPFKVLVHEKNNSKHGLFKFGNISIDTRGSDE
jgi:hypothetical protein